MKVLSLLHADYFNLFARLLQRKSKYHFRLIDFKNKQYKSDILLSQTKCNLEILPQGVMVIGNFTERDTIIPVLKSEIKSITIVRGKEIIDTFYLSPMHILSKFGIPNHISKYLKVYPSEYSITETQITIKCEDFQLKLITGGNRFEKLLRTVKKMGYSNILTLVEKPSLNFLKYNT